MPDVVGKRTVYLVPPFENDAEGREVFLRAHQPRIKPKLSLSCGVDYNVRYERDSQTTRD